MGGRLSLDDLDGAEVISTPSAPSGRRRLSLDDLDGADIVTEPRTAVDVGPAARAARMSPTGRIPGATDPDAPTPPISTPRPAFGLRDPDSGFAIFPSAGDVGGIPQAPSMPVCT